MSTVTLKGVSKSYGRIKALDSIDLEFKEGTIYGLLGRNGAGKSTLLSSISGCVFPDCGSIEADGVPIRGNDAALSKIHMMSEQTLYYPRLRVKDMFSTGAMFYENYDMEYAMKLCEEYKLDAKKRISSLSTGYRSIAKIINALSCGAQVVMFDEPVLGLDANHRDMFYRQLMERYEQTGSTYIISTHIIEEIATLIERAVIIKEGRIILDDESENIRSMGFAVTGKAEDVTTFTAGMNIIGEDNLMNLKAVYVMGLIEKEIPPTIEISPLSIQNLFIHLTNS